MLGTVVRMEGERVLNKFTGRHKEGQRAERTPTRVPTQAADRQRLTSAHGISCRAVPCGGWSWGKGGRPAGTLLIGLTVGSVLPAVHIITATPQTHSPAADRRCTVSATDSVANDRLVIDYDESDRKAD